MAPNSLSRQLLFLSLLACIRYSWQTDSGFVSVSVAPYSSKLEIRTENIPKECEELGFCEDSKFYPELLAKTLSQKLKQARFIIDADSNDTASTPVIGPRTFSAEIWNPCRPKTEEFYTPVLVRGVNGSWHYAINSKSDPIQQYSVGRCPQRNVYPHNPNSECLLLALKDGYTPRCVQKYATRTIVVMNHGDLTPIQFYIPCCCTCVAVPNE